MTILIVSQHSIELARCANLEILAVMPVIFDCFEAAPAGENLVRALEIYQQALEELTPPQIERATLDEMISAHARIRAAFLAAADTALLPSELIRQIRAAFDDFATGLERLQKTPSSRPSVH